MQESFLKKCQTNFLFSAKLKQVFKKKKNTIMLFSCQLFTGEKLEKIGMWMLGAKIGMKKKQCQLIDDNGVKTQQIFLTQKHSFHIHENDKNRVVGIDLLKFEETEEENKLSNLLIALALIEKISSESQIKIYAVVNPNNEKYKSIRQQLKLKFSTLSFIEWVWNPEEGEEAEEEKDGNMSIIKNDGEYSKGPVSIEKLFPKNNDAINGLGKYIKYISLKLQPESPHKGGKAKQNKQNTLIKSFQTTRGNLTKYIFSLIKPLTKIFEQVYLGNDFENSELNELLINQLSEIKCFVDGQEQLKNLKNLIKMPHIKKMDDYFAWKYYTMSYIMLRQQSEQKQKKKVDPSIELFKDFVHKLYQNLIYTPLTISEENIRYFNVIVNLVAEQFQLLELISQKYCGFQVQEVYLVLNLKYKNQEIKLMEIQEKIAENSVKAELKSNKSSEYYITISQLLQNSFSNKLNIDKLANKDEIKKNFKQIQQKLPMLRTIAVIQNPYEQSAELIKAIKYFFEMHFNISNQLKFSSDSLFKIFKGIGRSLRDFGLPQLALEVYKKLKFQNLIERCVNDIIIKQKLSQQKQGSELLLKTGRYFYINGNTAKAARFAQLAYQNCPDISYIKDMIKFKSYNMNNSIQGDELELLAKLTETNDFNSYFNYEFDQSFKQSISLLQQLVQNQQVNLDIVVTQEELSKFSFFSQALTEDD